MSYQAALARNAFPEAEAILRDRIAREPDNPAALFELGRVLRSMGRWREANDANARCHALAPGDVAAQVQYGMSSLAVGDYPRGWALWGRRIEYPEFGARGAPLPYWRGEPLAGKTILVMSEQGLGDQIQCARFMLPLLHMGARVLCETQPPLVRLFDQVSAAFSATGGSRVQIARPDVYTHPFSLPRWLGVTVEDLPGEPYFRAAPRQIGSGRIGVAWRGNPGHRWDCYRSLDPAAAQRLLSLPGAVSLEPADTGAQDFLETAEIIAGLDHVLAVDTAVAHLAGALGKPVSILVPAWGSDWRWMEHREDTPWYPTARLYRQRSPGDWNEVIDRVVADLG